MKEGIIVDDLRLIGIPGTNKVMAGEFSRLVRRAFNDVKIKEPAKAGLGALIYPFEPRLAALAVTYHRTASRVLRGLYRSEAKRLEPLYDDLLAGVSADTRGWFKDGMTFSIAVSNVASFEAGGRQIVGVVKNALVDGAKMRGVSLSVDPDNPDFRLDVRMNEDTLTVAMDLAGRPMNQRGYRTDRGLAPLRENLAAVLLMLARYDSRFDLLLDPMAGSGTIAIEAALMARGQAVWSPPRAPMAKNIEPYSEFIPDNPPPLFGDAAPAIIASDIDKRMKRVTQKNMEAAGVEGLIEPWCADFRSLDAEMVKERAKSLGLERERGLIVSNPPYGERLDPDDLNGLYSELGEWARTFKGWRAAFIVANTDFEAAFGGRARIKKPLSNGPLKGYFLQYDL
ncbi:MAG: hypothetical protein C0609_05985 [Deltaproteobacteria bacterium]|nr:MAG: hypothetical protein C0609_05985 [Deltaproteobacteria bacterium]